MVANKTTRERFTCSLDFAVPALAPGALFRLKFCAFVVAVSAFVPAAFAAVSVLPLTLGLCRCADWTRRPPFRRSLCRL